MLFNNLPNSALKTDVTIVGAGLVGLSAAIAMHEAGYSVVLVDSKNPYQAKAKSQDWDTRIYAISPKNAQWLTDLGVWQQLNPARIGEMQGMEIWGDATQTPLSLSADDINADDLGFIVEAGALMQVLLEKVQRLNITTLFDANCETVTVSNDHAVLSVTSIQQHQSTRLESALLLAADGSQSWIRAQLNFPLQQKNYEHTAVVANFKAEYAHQNIARQWFKSDENGKLQVLAWLPMPENIISIVWSVPTVFAQDLLQLSAEAFAQKVAEAGQQLLGDFKLLSPAASFPLALQTTQTPVQNCAVLLGDAAHQVHPMAGQGVNLGFRDVVDLMLVLEQKKTYQAINDTQLLKHYARLRKADVLNMKLLTDGLYGLFNHQSTVIKKVRHWGFEATKQQQIKRMLALHAVNT